jgi:nucleotide-binding universal stress UspA family protein
MMKVLVAMDGSEYGEWGLDWVATLPFVKPPRVTALHVLDSAWLRLPFRTKLEVQRVKARAARVLKRTKQQLASLNLEGTACEEQGAVTQTILKRAPKQDGFLVAGSKGLDALDRFLLGSVSTKLIQYAPCPVLVVKGKAVPLRRIILGLDRSEASAKALEFVLAKFRPDGSNRNRGRKPIHVSVVHVMPFKYPGSQEIGILRGLVEQDVQKLIEAGFTSQPVCVVGNPAEEILDVATTQHADLIVLGAKGLSGIDRFLLGSVSTRVVQHAKTAVLVVR